MTLHKGKKVTPRFIYLDSLFQLKRWSAPSGKSCARSRSNQSIGAVPRSCPTDTSVSAIYLDGKGCQQCAEWTPPVCLHRPSINTALLHSSKQLRCQCQEGIPTVHLGGGVISEYFPTCKKKPISPCIKKTRGSGNRLDQNPDLLALCRNVFFS